ncbi:hypothetical protein V1477_008820 [Vespula maculifrons]|uniref:Uncharacterized protein n=2 Tax=Vespula TaxID=7451 RepID=A0A834N1W9_VESVU|nr:hypothetical protein HZH66_009668 [Vespula vulgaris]
MVYGLVGINFSHIPKFRIGPRRACIHRPSDCFVASAVPFMMVKRALQYRLNYAVMLMERTEDTSKYSRYVCDEQCTHSKVVELDGDGLLMNYGGRLLWNGGQTPY